jgi:hypothetical protein
LELRLDPLHHLTGDVAVMVLVPPACEVASAIDKGGRESAEEFAVGATDQPDPLGAAKVAQPVDKDLAQPATEYTGMSDKLEGRCFQGQSGYRRVQVFCSWKRAGGLPYINGYHPVDSERPP